MGYVVKK